jgi:hypothetical protein
MLKEGVIWEEVHLTAHEIGKASLSFFHRTHRSQQAVKKTATRIPNFDFGSSLLRGSCAGERILLICYAAIEGLLKLGILQGDKEDILKTRTSVAFFPHGLGHYLGMDTVKFILVPS